MGSCCWLGFSRRTTREKFRPRYRNSQRERMVGQMNKNGNYLTSLKFYYAMLKDWYNKQIDTNRMVYIKYFITKKITAYIDQMKNKRITKSDVSLVPISEFRSFMVRSCFRTKYARNWIEVLWLSLSQRAAALPSFLPPPSDECNVPSTWVRSIERFVTLA